MTNQASRDAYALIQARNLLGPFQLEVLEIIMTSGPLTVGDASVIYTERHPETKRGRNEVAKRFNELLRLDIVSDSGSRRQCPITNIDTTVWDMTNHVPEERDQRLSAKKKIEALMASLKQAVRVMEENGLNGDAKTFNIILEGISEL